MTTRIPILLGGLLLAASAAALHDPALVRQGELPRDQYLDLVHAEKVKLDMLCLKFSEDTRVRLRDGRFVSLERRDLSALDAFLAAHPGIVPERLFQCMEEKALDEYVAEAERLSGYDNADLNNWYLLRVPQPNREAKALLEELLAIDLVQTCYYEPRAMPAVCGQDVMPATPLWEAFQDYREAAPTGVDIDWAWAHSTNGNGNGSYWWVDIEGGWCETHEDFGAFSIINPPDSTDPDWYNHGTAVVSIIAACDDGKGVTGLTPDCTARAINVFNHTSTADAILAAAITLIQGETYLIELHAPGPSQGTTCPCNCGQFEYIAMEYWTANFDAILANATGADQLICVEAAGNGSMDLDWPGYGGAFNPGVRDSQAILVGAGTAGASHDPMCYTNHGQRISAYGWGEGVYAAGYGYLHNYTGCEQDYDNDFGGTSSATPIVAGAAISLANIHYEQEGAHAAPTTIRARLLTNGTPQASEFSHEISMLPNMRGILAPDLATYTLGGWTFPVIANNIYDNHIMPASLEPAPDSTYFSWSWINYSRYSEAADSPLSSLYIDDVLRWTAGSSLARYTATYVRGVNRFINGGRHVVRQELDADGSLAEGSESNNRFAASYCWGGVDLASNVPQEHPRAPLRTPTGYVYPSCDGFDNNGNLGGWWEVFGVMPETDTDYDLRLYDTAPTATIGWDNAYVAHSSSTSYTDYVLANQNQGGVSSALWLGVNNYSDGSNNYVVEGQASSYIGIVPATQTVLGSGDLGAGEILDVWEFNATAGQQVWFRLLTDGEATVSLKLFGPATTYDNYGGYEWQLVAGATTPEVIGTYTVAEGGYHGLVLNKRDRGHLADDVDYTIYWGLAADPDLAVGPYSGYDAELVARNTGTCGDLPAQLDEGTSYLDAGINNLGDGYAAPGWQTRFLLEGRTLSHSGPRTTWLTPGGEYAWCGGNLGIVKGGRHEVGVKHDVYGDLVETDE
ncbi:MAG: S8 family serine peptidase, partial [Acidobacteriota bacterium]